MNIGMFVAVSLVPSSNGPRWMPSMQLRNTDGEESTAFTAYLLPVLKVTNYINPEKYPGKTAVRTCSLGTPSKVCGRRRGARELDCLV